MSHTASFLEIEHAVEHVAAALTFLRRTNRETDPERRAALVERYRLALHAAEHVVTAGLVEHLAAEPATDPHGEDLHRPALRSPYRVDVNAGINMIVGADRDVTVTPAP